MRTIVERKLERIQEIAGDAERSISCDVYYNSLGEKFGEQFVVRLSGSLRYGSPVHFRTNSIRKSLNLAIDYLKRTLYDNR